MKTKSNYYFILALLATVLLANNVPLAQGQTLQVLYSFQGAPDGANPTAGLVQGSDGNYYGTTGYGGTVSNHGTAFKITSDGTLSILHSFGDPTNSAPVGDQPLTTMVQGANGNFYGTADFVVFELTPGGEYTVLNQEAGGAGGSGLILGTDGNFYGENAQGGVQHSGRVYEMTPDGVQFPLFSFPFNGALQFYTRLTQDSDGNLYGVDLIGGSNGVGSVFKISRTPDDVGNTLTNLVVFAFTNGAYPAAGLVLGSDGNFYGTTSKGTNGFPTYGTIFRMTTNGTLTTLFTFSGTNGGSPSALVQASDGNFYGTTSSGGVYNRGTTFRLTTNGVFTTLISFNGTNGLSPQAELVQGTDGNFYGTTLNGGAYGNGTVFRITIPPALQSMTQNNGMINLAWGILPKQKYQVQYKPDLGSPNWLNLGGSATASNTVVTVSDAMTNSHCFYRIQLLP